MRQFLRPKLIFTLVTMVILVGAGISILPVGAQKPTSLRSQMETVAKSSAASAVRTQLTKLVSDPSLGKWATELTTQGGTNLTSFQRELLKAVGIESTYGDVLTKRLNGTQLSGHDNERLLDLQDRLSNNPAIQRLLLAGAQLKKSPSLAPDISNVVNTLNGPKPTPTSTGDTPRDAVLADLSSVFNGSSFAALSSSAVPVLSNSGAPALISTLPPEVVATFLPPAQTIALLLPNDLDPPLTDIIKSSLEVISGIAGTIAVIALAPEELAGAALVGVVAGIIAGVSAATVGVIDLGTALDCDHDGDPWDPADAPGNEC